MKTLRPSRFISARACARVASLALLGIFGLAGSANAQSGTYGDLVDFNINTIGAGPTGALVCDSAGNRYQALSYGGSGGGYIVKWTSAGVMSVVHTFGGTITNANGSTGPDGTEPGPLAIDASGNLYGVTQGGGPNRDGIVFEITTGGQYLDLHDFGGTITLAGGGSGPDGKYPNSAVTVDQNGNIFGVTPSGGPNTGIYQAVLGSGMAFEITNGGVYKDLHDFGGTTTYTDGTTGVDGQSPMGSVTLDSSGNIYGTASQGGYGTNPSAFLQGSGLVWEITSGGAYKDLHDFGKTITRSNGSSGVDGTGPAGRLIFDSAGDMIGVASYGGTFNGGVIWEITSAHAYKDLHDFGGSSVTYSNGQVAADGVAPQSGVVIDAAGDLFGVTYNGGPNYSFVQGTYGAQTDSGGVLWELSAAGTYTALHAFGGHVTNANNTTGWDGMEPNGITMDAAGNIWSTTFQGGPNDVPNSTLPQPHGDGILWELYYASLSSISVSPTSVVGGASPTGTVTLTGPAAPSGSKVTLSSNSSYATVPASVTVPAGNTSATFAISTFGVTTATTVTISAAMTGTAKSAPLTINPAPNLTVSLNPASVVGGATSVGTVTLSTPAGVNGAVVNLSSNSSNASVPASVFVYAGSLTGTFTVNTAVVASTATATISAKLGTASASAVLTINATSASAISVTPNSVFGLTSTTGTVVLAGPAPLGGKIVYLTSSNACAVVPSYVYIPTGASSGTFTITTTKVNFDTTVTIGANLNGIKTTTLTVKASALSGITLANYGQAFCPGTTTATLTLNGPAGADGALVYLSSSDPIAKVPASVYFAPGATTANATITLSGFAQQGQMVTITATEGLQTYSALLTLSVPVLTGLTVAPNSVVGGQTATATPSVIPSPNGTTVYLSSNNACATVPSSVAGGFPVTITTTAVTTLTTVTITAYQGSTSFSQTLVVAPDGLSTLSLAPTSVAGGQTSTATLTLAKAAPTYGLVVSLASSNTAAATVPASVYVAAGATTAVFTVSTKSVYSTASATISAAFDGTTASAVITVNPVNVATLTLTPASVKGGANSTGTVTLNAPAGPYGATVYLSSNSSSATVPYYVFVGAGATTAKFTVSTTSVAATTTAAITATTGSVNVSANLTVTH